MNINSTCCAFRIRKSSNAITRFFDKRLKSSGLKATQFTMLAEIGDCKGIIFTDVADKLGVDRTTFTRNLQPLIKAGLVTTRKKTDDARAHICKLTKKGEELLASGAPLWKSAQDAIYEAMGKAEYDRAIKSIELIRARANELNRLN